jgi:hypothetical protein
MQAISFLEGRQYNPAENQQTAEEVKEHLATHVGLVVSLQTPLQLPHDSETWAQSFPHTNGGGEQTLNSGRIFKFSVIQHLTFERTQKPMFPIDAIKLLCT